MYMQTPRRPSLTNKVCISVQHVCKQPGHFEPRRGTKRGGPLRHEVRARAREWVRGIDDPTISVLFDIEQQARGGEVQEPQAIS